MEQRGPGPDGARGYSPTQGLLAVFGGENIEQLNKGVGAMSPATMREYLLAAPDENGSYDDDARRFGKALLAAVEGNPERFLADSSVVAREVSDAGNYDLTGFMAGWAINAVRYVLGAHSVANPAIVEIG